MLKLCDYSIDELLVTQVIFVFFFSCFVWPKNPYSIVVTCSPTSAVERYGIDRATLAKLHDPSSRTKTHKLYTKQSNGFI